MLVTAENVVITFDGITDVAITVSEEYKSKNGDHKLSGMCGNHDGNPGNDFVDYQGVARKNPKLLGEVYMDENQGECKENILMSNLIYMPSGKSYGAYSHAESQCSVIDTDFFRPCHAKVNPESFKRMCMQDVALCNYDKFQDCTCSSLAMYSKVCLAQGITLSWRRNGLCRKYLPFLLSCELIFMSYFRFFS